MRFYVVFFACISLATFAKAQDVKVADGKVWLRDTIYCLYSDNCTPDKSKHNAFQSATMQSGEWMTGDFCDFRISAPDSEEMIVARARVMADPVTSYLQYYYCIKLLLIDKEINILRRPYMEEYFLKDLAKYHVFENGHWSDNGAANLYEAWVKKSGYIKDETVARASTTNYNKAENTYTTAPDDALPVTIKDSNIYLSDSLIGSFKEQRVKNSDDYTIYDTHGKQKAMLEIMHYRTQSYLWIGENTHALTLVSADKTPDKMLKVAVYTLRMKGVI